MRGSLSITLEILATLLASAILLSAQDATSQAKNYSFDVPAARPWTDTGLDLARGQRVHVYGPVSGCGGSSPTEKAHLPQPSAPAGALLVKIHLDAAPVSATPDAELPIIEPSHLYLGVNGSACPDAIIHAKIHIDPAPATEQPR